MSEIKIFDNREFGSVRVVNKDGEPWFVASDVAKALGYERPADAVNAHCKKVNKISQYCDSENRKQVPPVNFNIIPESDVYRLIMRSNLPSAEKFQDWVCEEVLPAIRKTGMYGKWENIREKIQSNIVISDSGCWEWTGCVQSNGYSRIRFDGKTHYGHRVSFMAFVGAILPGMDICHACDNRKCVNPEHLFMGTRKDNMVDCVKKGRSTRGRAFIYGDGTSNAKLSAVDVKNIRFLSKGGVSLRVLSKNFGVHIDTVRAVIKRKTWRHI